MSVYYSLEFRGNDGASYHPYLDKLLFFENGSLVKQISKWEDNFFFWMIPWFDQSILITGGSKHTCFSNSGDSLFSVVKVRDPFGMYVEPINQNECLTARYLAGLCRVFASGEISWVLPYSLIIGSEELYPIYYDFKVLDKNNVTIYQGILP